MGGLEPFAAVPFSFGAQRHGLAGSQSRLTRQVDEAISRLL